MYVPASFKAEGEDPRVRQLIEGHPFATLITPTPEQLWVSHVPLLARPAQTDGALVLTGHLARANGHSRALGAGETTAIFHGPHAYVSPTWYATAPAVPTWNYAVIHAIGHAVLLDDEIASFENVSTLTRTFEDPMAPWRPTALPEDLRRSLLGAIVAFEVRVARVEAKLKLGQNRSPADRRGAIARLEASGDGGARALAALMRATLHDEQ
jgi:transcriptional regulator